LLFQKRIPKGIETVKPTILIVDDHEGIRLFLRALLSESLSGYHIFEAKDGEEAVALAFFHSPGIVLMDIGLPKMSGIEATQRIKDALPQTHVIIITNHEAHEFEKEAAIAGASAYVLKYRVHTDLIPILTKLLSQP
jgi:DNA-binding NarL/FixJ family response regulator